MRRSHFSDEDIAALVRQTELGRPIEEACDAAHITPRTMYRWKQKFGTVDPAAARRISQLENENNQLRELIRSQSSQKTSQRNHLAHHAYREGSAQSHYLDVPHLHHSHPLGRQRSTYLNCRTR